MAAPNISELATTTLSNRSGKIANNVLKNNVILSRLNRKGRVRTISGGVDIREELSYAENGNFGYYSGYDLLPVAAQDVLSSASFALKQAACAIVISGLEELQNMGKERVIDLLEARMSVAESTMQNNLCSGIYSDGTGSGGKQITGLQAAISATPTTGTYGGIDRATWTFWQNQLVTNTSYTNLTIYGDFLDLWVKMVRGKDKPDLIVADNNVYVAFEKSLQAQQRFTSPSEAEAGFPSLKFHTCDVVLDGGIGGFCPSDRAFFLNTDYISWRPHKSRNMVPLAPDRRAPVNQDATVAILAWAGNLTTSGAQFQGLFKGS